MTKEFILYQEALALKQLGFDESCFGWFASDRTLVKEVTEKTDFTLAPTYSQAFRFFREKHGLFHSVERESAQEYFCNYSIKEFDGIKNIDHRGNGYRYEEEAELECLKKLIEIVKQNKL
jgi:hypothetical protein